MSTAPRLRNPGLEKTTTRSPQQTTGGAVNFWLFRNLSVGGPDVIMTGKQVTSVSDSLQTWGPILICLISPISWWDVEMWKQFPEAQFCWCICFPATPHPGGENNQILTLVIQRNLAPVYINMVEMKKKKNWKKKKEINYLSSINIKENCKTESGVTMLLLQNHLVIASGKMLLSLISVQQNCLGCTRRGACVCLLSRTLSSLPTGSSRPSRKLHKDYLLEGSLS